MGRSEEQDVLPREVELTRRGGLGHEVPQAVDTVPLVGVGAHIVGETRGVELRHPEHQGHRLHQLIRLPAHLIRHAGQARQVPVVGAVHDHAGRFAWGAKFERDSRRARSALSQEPELSSHRRISRNVAVFRPPSVP